jgi:hypothetical protein
MAMKTKNRDPNGPVAIADAALEAVRTLPEDIRVHAIIGVISRMLEMLNKGLDALQTEAISKAEKRADLAEQEAAAARAQIASIGNALQQIGTGRLPAAAPTSKPQRLTSGRPTPKAHITSPGKRPGRPALPRDEFGNKIRSPEATPRLAALAAASREQKEANGEDIHYQPTPEVHQPAEQV